MGQLLVLLDGYALGDADVHDEMIWLLNEDYGFSVKSMFDLLALSKQYFFPWNCLWNPVIQTKASFLLWELW